MGAAASDLFGKYADIQYGFLDYELDFGDRLHMSAQRGRHRIVSLLLKNGMNPNAPRVKDKNESSNGDTPLICAARGTLRSQGQEGHLKSIKRLVKFGADVNLSNYLGETPLNTSCQQGLILVSQLLLQNGADPNKCCKAGYSPLLWACRNQNLQLVELLLEHGANVFRIPLVHSTLKLPPPPHEQLNLASPPEEHDGKVDVKLEQTGNSENNLTISEIKRLLQAKEDDEVNARAKLLEEIHEAKWLEEQRKYREKEKNRIARQIKQRRERRARSKYHEYLTADGQIRPHLLQRKSFDLQFMMNENGSSQLQNSKRMLWEKHERKGGDTRWKPRVLPLQQASSPRQPLTHADQLLNACETMMKEFRIKPSE